MFWYEKGADLGSIVCQFYLGEMYEKGWGGTRDYHQAHYWYTKAAELQLADQSQVSSQSKARMSLGRLYYYGQGVNKDYEKALYWLQKAVEQNNPHARAFLREPMVKRRLEANLDRKIEID